MRLVVDTNVLVSGLLSPHGPPGYVVQEIVSARVTLCLDGRILAEYGEVLRRPRFLFSEQDISEFLRVVREGAEFVDCRRRITNLPDPDDEPFLEVAIASMAEGLVTGNIAHFPPDLCEGVRVFTPREFLDARLQESPPP